MKVTGLKILNKTDVKYGIIRITEGEIIQHLPSLFLPITIIDEEGCRYEKRMHLSVKNRIDGLTKLYRKYKVGIGDTVELELIGNNELKMSFKHSCEASSKKDDSDEKNQLIETINSIKAKIEKMEYLFYDNEMNVRTELNEPILNELDWHSPDLAREQKGYSGRRVDIALYKNNMDEDKKDCLVLIEAKAIDEHIPNEKIAMQLMSYLDDNQFKSVPYGILTNGQVWLLYGRNGSLLQAINICKTEIREIYEFFIQLHFANLTKETKIEEQKIEDSIELDYKKTTNLIIHENEQIIKGGNSTETFQKFIEKHLGEVEKLQKNNRFPVIILAKKENDVRNASPVNNSRLFITGDHSTFQKRMLIKQIIFEAQIDAWVEEVKEQ